MIEGWVAEGVEWLKSNFNEYFTTHDMKNDKTTQERRRVLRREGIE